MKELLNKFIREISDREALHILQHIWGYDRAYQELEPDERKEIKGEDIVWTKALIKSTFGESNTDIASLDAHMFSDMEGWTFQLVAETFNYLYRRGILV